MRSAGAVLMLRKAGVERRSIYNLKRMTSSTDGLVSREEEYDRGTVDERRFRSWRSLGGIQFVIRPRTLGDVAKPNVEDFTSLL